MRDKDKETPYVMRQFDIFENLNVNYFDSLIPVGEKLSRLNFDSKHFQDMMERHS